MTSSISWLDYSEEDQQQLRNLIGLFTESGTLDDLGIGTLRDAISNHLFPGTSTVQTRSRYFLFIPWIFRHAEQKRPRQLVEKANDMERRLIGALLAGGDENGVIGRRAGANVRTLPSSIYWTGLSKYQIFAQSTLTIRQYGRRFALGPSGSAFEGELVERSPSFWNREIPDPPDDFFDFDSTNFEFSTDEASWLSERIASSAGVDGTPNLLSLYLSELREKPEIGEASYFWEASAPANAPSHLRELILHARQFSLANEGASILYNLLLAEKREQLNPPLESDAFETGIEAWRDQSEQWADRARSSDLGAWAASVDDFASCLQKNFVAPPKAFFSFVQPWANELSRDLAIVDSDSARKLIHDREWTVKGSQARLENEKRLRSWVGNTGTAPLDFRWSQIRTMLSDISRGLESPAESANDARA